MVCDQRKGKRACPAKDALICPNCCGEKRVLEMRCPESCEYLKIGRKLEVAQHMARHVASSDPTKNLKHERVLKDYGDFVAELGYIIAEERRSSRDLTDKEAAEALDLLLDTLRTEDKGIFYERASNDLRVEVLRRQMQDLVQRHRYPSEPSCGESGLVSSQHRLSLRDTIMCLEVIRDIVASHMKAGPTSLGYVDFLARQLPSGSRIDDAGPSIIIPGR